MDSDSESDGNDQADKSVTEGDMTHRTGDMTHRTEGDMIQFSLVLLVVYIVNYIESSELTENMVVTLNEFTDMRPDF